MLVVDKCVVLLSSFKAGVKVGVYKKILLLEDMLLFPMVVHKKWFNKIIAVRKMINIIF